MNSILGVPLSLKILGLCVAVAALCALVVQSQGLRMDDRIRFQRLDGPGTGNTRAPLLGIIVWRGKEGWSNPVDDADRIRIDSTMVRAQRQARAMGAFAFGMGNAMAVVDTAYSALMIEGHVFDLSRRDSALVVMVSVPSTPGPRTVITARIDAFNPPETDFTLEETPNGPRLTPVPYLTARARLHAYLAQSPAVAAFLR